MMLRLKISLEAASLIGVARCLTLLIVCMRTGSSLYSTVTQLLSLLFSAQLDLDLPQIAVIGNQSAGKSSLIESIAGARCLSIAPPPCLIHEQVSVFHAPVAHARGMTQADMPLQCGMLTPCLRRCPTECRLAATTKAWQCTVSLRFIVEEDGSPCNPVRNVFFGPVITDKDEVEDRLRRAQLAILHPDDSPEHYLDVDDLDNLADQQSGFSTNYISLQISGPDVPDLSFVDLPGIIASVQKGEQKRNIELVRNLVSDHIRRPSCIIMLTVSCESMAHFLSDWFYYTSLTGFAADFENQGAFELAREFDPDGQRTIGKRKIIPVKDATESFYKAFSPSRTASARATHQSGHPSSRTRNSRCCMDGTPSSNATRASSKRVYLVKSLASRRRNSSAKRCRGATCLRSRAAWARHGSLSSSARC